MQTIVLGTPAAEQSLTSLLRSTGCDEVEIVDEQGSIVARLTPADPISPELYARVAQVFRADAADLQRRFANRTTGKTTAELMAGLQTMGGPSCATP